MSKDPYKIIDSKPSWSSRLGSSVVAVGSVATAIAITVPGLPGYEFLSPSEAAGPQSSSDNSDPLLSGQTIASDAAEVTRTTPASTSSATKLNGIDSVKVSPKPKKALELPGIESGNTSSSTPYSGSGGSAPGSGADPGNTSSPTPGGGTGGSYEDEDSSGEDSYGEDSSGGEDSYGEDSSGGEDD
jgi:hypothetical protein